MYGRDQDDGVEKLDDDDGDGGSSARAQACLLKCRAVPNATGCELIWGQAPAQLANGCYVHTQGIASGNGQPNHACWVFVRPNPVSRCNVAKSVIRTHALAALTSGGITMVNATFSSPLDDSVPPHRSEAYSWAWLNATT